MLCLVTSAPFLHVGRLATQHLCAVVKLTFAYCSDINIVYCSEVSSCMCPALHWTVFTTWLLFLFLKGGGRSVFWQYVRHSVNLLFYISLQFDVIISKANVRTLFEKHQVCIARSKFCYIRKIFGIWLAVSVILRYVFDWVSKTTIPTLLQIMQVV